MTFQITVAEKIIEIHTVYDFSYYYCLEYVTHKPTADIIIKVTEQEIENEINIQGVSLHRENPKSVRYSYGHTEFLILLRKLCDQLLNHSIFLMHGVIISDGQWGYAFSAPSGTGKTTRAKYLKSHLEGISIINGDKPFIKVDDKKITAFGTPWCGKEYMGKNDAVPLRAIFFLERAEKTDIRRLTTEEALPYLIRHTHFPKKAESYKPIITLLIQLGKTVDLYRYCSTADIKDVLKAYNVASKNSFN